MSYFATHTLLVLILAIVIGNLRKKSLFISIIVSLQFCPMLFVCSGNKKWSLKIFFSSFQKQNIALLKKVELRSKKLKVINLYQIMWFLTTKFMLCRRQETCQTTGCFLTNHRLLSVMTCVMSSRRQADKWLTSRNRTLWSVADAAPVVVHYDTLYKMKIDSSWHSLSFTNHTSPNRSCQIRLILCSLNPAWIVLIFHDTASFIGQVTDT